MLLRLILVSVIMEIIPGVTHDCQCGSVSWPIVEVVTGPIFNIRIKKLPRMKTFLVKFRKFCSKFNTVQSWKKKRLIHLWKTQSLGTKKRLIYDFSIHSPSYDYVWYYRRGAVHLHTKSVFWFNVSNLALQSSSEDKKEATDWVATPQCYRSVTSEICRAIIHRGNKLW